MYCFRSSTYYIHYYIAADGRGRWDRIRFRFRKIRVRDTRASSFSSSRTYSTGKRDIKIKLKSQRAKNTNNRILKACARMRVCVYIHLYTLRTFFVVRKFQKILRHAAPLYINTPSSWINIIYDIS